MNFDVFECFFNVLIKLKQNSITFFSIFTKKTWIVELKMTIFQILIKWQEMVVSGCYIAQNDRNLQKNPEIEVRSRFSTRNIVNLKKKARGYKNEQKFFCHFWFCAICVSTKSCLILKFVPPNLPAKILFFESISVFISQKLRNLEYKNFGCFFPPSRYLLSSN